MSWLSRYLSKQEAIWLGAIWLLLSGLSLVPFLFAWPHLHDGSALTGVRLLTQGDISVYLSYFRQLNDGVYPFQNLFTTETGQSGTLFPWWLLSSLFGRLISPSPVVAYHAARVLYTGVLLLVLYVFIKQYVTKPKSALWTVGFMSFATGCGAWLLPLFTGQGDVSRLPIDLAVPEAFIFLSTYHSPHFTLSWAALVLVYLMWILSIKAIGSRLAYKRAIMAGLIALVLFVAHPYHIVPVYCIIVLHCAALMFVQKKQAKQFFYVSLAFVSVSLWGALYHVVLLPSDWTLYMKAIHNINPTPVPLFVITGFGLLLCFAVASVFRFYRLKKLKDPAILLLVTWVICQAVLIYIPVPWQRRMIQGWQVPLVILTAMWFMNLFESKKFRRAAISVFIVMPLFVATSLFHVGWDSVAYRGKSERYYFEPTLNQGFTWMRQHTSPDDGILARPWISNSLPGATGRRVYAGHSIETPDAAHRFALAQKVFSQSVDPLHLASWLKAQRITLVFIAKPADYGFGEYLQSNQIAEMVYQNEQVRIYRVL
jgi:hypothetical protein